MEITQVNHCYASNLDPMPLVGRKTIPLADLADNHEAIVVKIDISDAVLTRLCHLGLTPNTRVRKLCSAPFGGPVEIRVRDALMAIGRGLAQHVLVTVEGMNDELSQSPAARNA